ncbi:dTDP-4-dehydrorhamnose reductase [Nocardia transvalensis]|uniref:dTDP-4-dehydrorhamnose reductase n=1 Tax=Nocardia transvalensis TaxID=37333 RepID=A0A7W9PAY9_9NOCA|nr:dTDP-4-dehydrorhamnose reductase [Nocardia transvalensis]MBB5912359.1 dTDP-4-dehydrorhamnose reductase [Nocardia transvalensis]
MTAVPPAAVPADRPRLVVTGAGGQLGRAVLAHEPAALALGHHDLDITDAAAVRKVLRPDDILLNCAAYTAVDAAESEPDAAFAGNATGPAVLAEECRAVGARMVHISTDYVFDGTSTRPYEPGDPTSPTSVYGRSKLAGEEAVLRSGPGAHIVRTAWVYTGDRRDFVATMRRLERERETVTVVDDQTGSPTFAPDLAAGLLELTSRIAAGDELPPILHATNTGRATWYDVARAVFAGVGADPDRVRPCTSAEYPSPVRRPAYSVLSDEAWIAAGLSPLRDWREALGDALRRVAD